MQHLISLFTCPTPRGVRRASIAAAMILIVQAGVIGLLLFSESVPDKTFTTASGPTAGADAGTIVLVRFSETSTVDDISPVLRSVNGQLVGGPKPGQILEVQLSKTKLSDTERDALIAKLKANPGIVTLVLPKG